MKGIVLALLVSLHASDNPETTPKAHPKEESSSYVHVTLISDAVAMGFGSAFVAGVRGSNSAPMISGAIGFPITAVFVPPVIHLLHNQRARAGWSLLLRVLTCAVGGVLGVRVGSSFSNSANEWGGLEGSLVGVGAGAMIGLTIAGVLDAALISRL